jgi:serine/threonine protein kinase
MPIFPFSKSTNFCLLDLIRDLLSVDPNHRGSAEALIERFRQLPIQSADQIETYSHVTAGDEELRHVRTIGSGGFGVVLEVI